MTAAPSPAESDGVVKGLDGVLACTTSISSIDGPGGELRYRGYEIRELIDRTRFEDVAQLLWLGRWPAPAERDRFGATARTRQVLSRPVSDLLNALPASAHPLVVLRAAIAVEASLDDRAEDLSVADVADRAVTVHALTGQVIGHIASRARSDTQSPPSINRTASLLQSVTGQAPSAEAIKALEAVLVTYAEHELNASTFTARTVIGTQSDYWSAITAAIGALKGPLHGGAVDDAIRLFIELGDPSAVPAYLDGALVARTKVPGFGHRVYRTRDPRAEGMERHAEVLSRGTEAERLLDTARELEAELGRRKGLSANVDYYGALVMHLLGFPHSVFSTLIAASRYAGWTAHIIEQMQDNRLIRPRAAYVGPDPRPVGDPMIAG